MSKAVERSWTLDGSFIPRVDWQELQRLALALIGDYCELLAPIRLSLNLILKLIISSILNL